MASRQPTGSRDGIEWRTDAKGRKSYRWVHHSAKLGKKRGEWTDSHAEAKSGRAKFMGELHAGTAVRSSNATLRDAWAEFLKGAKAGTITSRSRQPFKPATLRGYKRGWAQIEPELGAHKLTDIRRRDVQALVDRWNAAGHSPSTIRNWLDPLRTIYRRALARDLVTINPTDGLEVPADRRNGSMRIADREEAAALIAALPEGDRALWATAMYGGLRRGELRALRWKDVDLSAKLISVRRNWDDTEGEIDPKSEGSTRRVPITPPLASHLEAQQRTTGRSGDDLVFGRSASKPFTPSTIGNRAKEAWKHHKPIGLHECRHTFASFMIDAGANAKALSVVMGHASITTTFDTYGHMMPGGEQEVGRLLAAYFAEQP